MLLTKNVAERFLWDFLQLVLIGSPTTTRVIVIIIVKAKLNTTHMTTNVKFFGRLFHSSRVFLWIFRCLTLLMCLLSGSCRLFIGFSTLENHGMHPISWAVIFVLAREKFFATHCTCDDVTHQRISLGQVSREIHLFPKSNTND